MNKKFNANAIAFMKPEGLESHEAATDFIAAHKGRLPPVHFIVATSWSNLGDFLQDSGQDAYDFVYNTNLFKDDNYDTPYVILGFDNNETSLKCLRMLRDSIGLNIGRTRTWILGIDRTLIPFDGHVFGPQPDLSYENMAALLNRIYSGMGTDPNEGTTPLLSDLPGAPANDPRF
jgi:hypothetical protein